MMCRTLLNSGARGGLPAGTGNPWFQTGGFVVTTPGSTSDRPAPGDARASARSKPATAPLPLRPGMLLADRFKLVRHVGRGGVGHVWLAQDIHLENDEVACKVLREDFSYDRRAITDMKREVLLTRKLRHRHILAVYTFWETSSRRFITMEYVEGMNLSQALQENRRPFVVEQILSWLDQLCQALDYAHSENILHRDVKPANILLGQDGVVRLADFGIARTAQELQTRFTGEMTCGTLLYMSPEQLLGDEVDARSDVYSLSATVYELLSGTPPFYEGALITQIQMKKPAPIKHLGDEVNDVLLKALAKNPAHRHATCGEFFSEFSKQVAVWRAIYPAPEVPPMVMTKAAPTTTWDPDAETVQMPAPASERHKPRIGMLLTQAGIVNEEQLAEALEIQERTGEKLGSVLVRLGYMAEEAMSDAVGRQLQVPFIRLEEATFDTEVAKIVSGRMARARRCIPVCREEGQIVIAMADPLDLAALNEVERISKERVDIRIAPEAAIMAAIDRIHGPKEEDTPAPD